MGLKERVYRGEAEPPAARVYEVEEWVFQAACRCRRPAGVETGDSGWVRIEDTPLDSNAVARDYLQCRVTDTAEDVMAVEVRDPALHEPPESSTGTAGVKQLLKQVIPG